MLVILVLSGTSMVYAQLNINTLSYSAFFYLMSGAVFAGIAAFVFASISVSCPHCGSRWFWAALSGKGHKEWLFWLNAIEACPRCGEPKDE